MDRYETAYEFAKKAHEGQTDKAGNDYINHPVAVAERLNTETEKVVALLHDTMEDCGVTYEEILDKFGREAADAVQVLTRRDDEDYFDYIKRIKDNPISKAVKLADLTHNMDLSRLPDPTEKDFMRAEKYKKAKSLLLDEHPLP